MEIKIHLKIFFLLYIWMGPRPWFPPPPPLEFFLSYMTNILHEMKESSYIKSRIKYNYHPRQFHGKTIVVAHNDFELKIWCGLEINMAHTNRAISILL